MRRRFVITELKQLLAVVLAIALGLLALRTVVHLAQGSRVPQGELAALIVLGLIALALLLRGPWLRRRRTP